MFTIFRKILKYFFSVPGYIFTLKYVTKIINCWGLESEACMFLNYLIMSLAIPAVLFVTEENLVIKKNHENLFFKVSTHLCRQVAQIPWKCWGSGWVALTKMLNLVMIDYLLNYSEFYPNSTTILTRYLRSFFFY